MVLGSILTSFSISWLKEASQCPLWQLLPILSQALVEGGSGVSTPSPAVTSRVSGHGHADWCDVMPHCSLDLHFSNK